MVLVSVLVVLVGGWLFRWMSDDGFIYLRVVDQVWAGNGPVFNAGERVEVATGPLWLWMLVAARLVPGIQLEWVAVILGLVFTSVGVGTASVAAQRMAGDWRGGFGVLAFATLPFTWHFATSGLETGLTFAWLGVTSLLLVGRSGTNPNDKATALTGFVIGLGPLIRPDFALVSGILLLGLLLTKTIAPTRKWVLLASALALPTTYQVFRMAYYRAVLPNTAIAKEAGLANWPQGLRYLADTLLNPTAVVIVVAAAAVLVTAKGRRNPSVMIGITGLLYTLAVVRAGGDFMRARLLLPALFLLAIAAAGSSLWRHRFLPILLILTAIVGVLDADRYDSRFGGSYIWNERSLYPFLTGIARPVTLDDFSAVDLVVIGRDARQRAARARPFVLDRTNDQVLTEIAEEGINPYTIVTGPIGMIGLSAGTGVYIVDRLSLADPIGARLELARRGRPGHEKEQPRAWLDAAIGFNTPDGQVAARARDCDRLRRLQEGVTLPLTPTLAWDNFIHALPDTTLRIPRDPESAVGRFCE
jgi:arabinofuranosyltransferase